MSRFSAAIAAGLEQIRDFAGTAIEYGTGGLYKLSISQAVPRKINPRVEDQFDQRELSNGKLWEVAVAELVGPDGSPMLPAKGHTIKDKATGERWLVVDQSVTGRCFEYLDAGASTLQIFTIREGA